MYSNKSLILLIIILFTSDYLFSQNQDINPQKTYTVAGITVDGNQFADASTIIAISGINVGDKITYPVDDKVSNAIKNIWERRQFSEVDIIASRVTPQGIFLTIKVKELFRISSIILEGNEEVKDKDIITEIGKTRGDLFSNYDIYLAKKKIVKLYEKEGYTSTKVDVEIIDSDTIQRKKLKFVVTEGAAFKVKSITFTGNKILTNSDLESAFDETKTKSWWQIWKSAKFDRNNYKKDINLLKSYFKKKGFIDGAVIQDTVIYNQAEETVDIKIDVNEGNKYYVRNIKFRGNTVYPEQLLLNRLEFQTGDVYDMERFEQNLRGNQALSDAQSLYNNNGYLAAQFEKEEVKIGEDSVDITINIYENDRFKIRRVEIIGNTKTKDKVIRRELFTRPGDFFDRSAIIRSVRALGAINYFNPEKLQPQPMPVPNDKTQVDILYKVEEKSTDTFNASIGFAGTFGLTGAIGFTFNNFSIDEPLFGGGGQIFNFNWEFGQLSRFQRFSIGYSQPWLNDEPTTFGFNIFDTRIRFNFEQRTTGVTLNFGRRLKWPDDYFRFDLSTRYQLNDNGQQGSLGSFFRPGRNVEAGFQASISRISLDHPFFATNGSRFSMSSNFAIGALGQSLGTNAFGNTDFLKNEFNFEFYNPLLKIKDADRLVLMLATRFGYLTGLLQDNALSPVELYRMGGNGLTGFGVIPLRGYRDQSIQTDQFGGKVMTRVTAEIRFSIAQDPMPIFVYAFGEAGNVWQKLSEADPFNLKRSAGIGLQLLLNPIGIVGFSYGYGFDPTRFSSNPSGWQFLFNLGQQF